MGVHILDRSKNIVLLGLALVMLSGCAAMRSCDDGGDVRLLRTPTEYMLNIGIKNYDDGDYAASMSMFQSLVENRAATKSEKLFAYKYLAFIHCISPNESKEQRERMCRDSFKKAFALNQNFALTPAEAGHPVWGPIFSSVKSKMSK
jgi:hypothetical protein